MRLEPRSANNVAPLPRIHDLSVIICPKVRGRKMQKAIEARVNPIAIVRIAMFLDFSSWQNTSYKILEFGLLLKPLEPLSSNKTLLNSPESGRNCLIIGLAHIVAFCMRQFSRPVEILAKPVYNLDLFLLCHTYPSMHSHFLVLMCGLYPLVKLPAHAANISILHK